MSFGGFSIGVPHAIPSVGPAFSGVVGASGGGTLAGNVAMGVAGATAPYGLLMAVFSGAS